jgi:hypothetical protein
MEECAWKKCGGGRNKERSLSFSSAINRTRTQWPELEWTGQTHDIEHATVARWPIFRPS